MLVPLEPLVEVAPEPLVDVPLEPITGALGATGALLGAVPMEAGGTPSGAIRGIGFGPGGRMIGRRATPLPGDRLLLARHSLMYLSLCLPV
jgi:hypothetical protein